MKHQVYTVKLPSVRLMMYMAAIFCLFLLSCIKHGQEPTPLPVWEDNTADSARLNILVQTRQGYIFTGQYVNLALSSDSLSKNILVRKTVSNGAGISVFRKLYPRVIYYNCIAITPSQAFFGSGRIRLSAGMTRDTTLIVQ